jgi:hypothetical protein
MIHKQREAHGRAATKELDQFYAQASIQRIQDARAVEDATRQLRVVNAERRLQDQRDLDADYRNYIIPV